MSQSVDDEQSRYYILYNKRLKKKTINTMYHSTLYIVYLPKL